MVDKKLPTGPIRISAPPLTTKKDDSEAIPTILENNDELSSTHESPTPTTLAQNPQKVSMRLSQEAATKLKQFRLDTGIPYEILVEVMVLNFESLPERSRKAYLEQARELRMQRLIAGQEKALETVRAKAKG
jgi:predicted DNA binding CopG/RHH family protein